MIDEMDGWVHDAVMKFDNNVIISHGPESKKNKNSEVNICTLSMWDLIKARCSHMHSTHSRNPDFIYSRVSLN